MRRGQTMPENDALVQVVKMHPEILQQMLSTVLNIIMFEDCRNQWSMSRPLLGLILLNEDYFQSLRDQVLYLKNIFFPKYSLVINFRLFNLNLLLSSPAWLPGSKT